MKNILGEKVKSSPKLKGKLAEQGTPVSGYEEHGPYHCEDCIHKTASDEPFCIHPIVISDPKLKSKQVVVDGKTVIKINLERGCCAYVNQPLEHSKEDSDYEED